MVVKADFHLDPQVKTDLKESYLSNPGPPNRGDKAIAGNMAA
jgi:hypothetical protein